MANNPRRSNDDRFMPATWQIKRELEELLPGRAERITELIEQLINETINERERGE